MSRAKTKQEVADDFLNNIDRIVDYWSNVKNQTNKEKCDGVAFSILVLIDGGNSMPSIDLTIQPHKDDKKYHIENNENYYEPNMIFNEMELHSYYYKRNNTK